MVGFDYVLQKVRLDAEGQTQLYSFLKIYYMVLCNNNL